MLKKFYFILFIAVGYKNCVSASEMAPSNGNLNVGAASDAPQAISSPINNSDDKKEPHIGYILETISYDYGKTNVSIDQKSTIDNNLKKMKDLIGKNYTFVIEGHTCNCGGSGESNTRLSLKRAQNIATYLEKQGIDKSRMRVVSRGAERLLVPIGSQTEQAANRRVEIYAYPRENSV